MLKPYGGLGVTTFQRDGSPAIYAFVTRVGGHLHVNWWNGQQWVWQDQGTPPGTTILSAPSVITFQGAAGSQAIYVFVCGANGHLYVNWWNGQQWVWQDQGTPPGTTVGSNWPDAITFQRDGSPAIYQGVTVLWLPPAQQERNMRNV